MDVQALKWYYLFIYKMAENCLNSNAKTDKWDEFAEFLRICVNQPCSEPFLIIFETKLEEMPESKSVAKW